MRVKGRTFGLLLVACVGIASAAPRTIPAELFFAPVDYGVPSVSPDGLFLGVTVRHDRKHFGLMSIDLTTGKSSVLVKAREWSVASIGWKPDHLLLAGMIGDDGHWGFTTIDVNQTKVTDHPQLNSAGVGAIVSLISDDPDHVLCWWHDGSLHKIELSSGKGEVVERYIPGIDRWIVDAGGTPWAAIGFHDEKWTFLWRNEPNAPWQRRDDASVHDARIYPLSVMPDRKRLVVVDRTTGSTARLAYFDLSTQALTEIFSNDSADITSCLNWGFRLQPCAALWHADREQHHFFLPEAASCFEAAAKALPNLDLEFASFSRNDHRAVVVGHAANDPGSFFLLDRDSGKISNIGVARADLTSADLAPSTAFQFSSRDGLTIHGRITHPRGLDRPPVILRVGPGIPGPKPQNDFDGTDQFFASRGFASARIAIRGTQGYGTTHRQAGDIEHMRGMVADLEDAARWLAAQNEIDPRRVVLFGERWGGLTALHAAANAQVFCALVNFNIPMDVRHVAIEQIAPSDRERPELLSLLGGTAGEVAYLKALDPLAAAARLKVPSFNWYPRQLTANAMVPDGEALERVLNKGDSRHKMYLPAPVKPDTDEAMEIGKCFEAVVAFLGTNLK